MHTQSMNTDKLGAGSHSPIFAMLEAHYALQEGGIKKAKQAMRSALTLCKQHGHTTLKLMHPRYLKDLLIWSYQQGIEKEYIKQSLKTLKFDTPDIVDLNNNISNIDKPIKICTLGQFTVKVDDQTLSYTRAGYNKPFDMLKAVIVFGGQQINRSRIIDTLWPDAEGDCARRNFDTTLHRLRKLLKHSKALLLHGNQLTLDTRYVWVDTWDFDQVFSELETEIHKMHPEPDTIEQLGQHMIRLYQGHFLQNDHVRPWTLSIRENLASRFNHQVTRLARYWHTQQQHDKAIDLLKRGIELDATAETLYQELMKLYLERGDMSLAASTYLRCRKALSAHLSVLPSSETVRIYKSIGLQAQSSSL